MKSLDSTSLADSIIFANSRRGPIVYSCPGVASQPGILCQTAALAGPGGRTLACVFDPPICEVDTTQTFECPRADHFLLEKLEQLSWW